MYRLHILQARYGDCLILEYGTPAAPRYLLVDGGPTGVYDDHLRPTLERIRDRGGTIEIAVLSHVDDDHVQGLLDLVNELQWQRVRGRPETIAINELWHNSFRATVGHEVDGRLHRLMARAASVRGAMADTSARVRDIEQGDQLTEAAGTLQIPVNGSFGGGALITLEGSPTLIERGNLRLHVAGPTQANLDALRAEWFAWLEERERDLLVPSLDDALRAAREADSRVPNLSSIMLLAKADAARVLLTGDGRADHLLAGLGQAGLLDPHGRLHVDVLKLPHHGSKYNISEEFIRAVTADIYVVSATGYHGHPHKETLGWIVQAARDERRPVEIIATNPAPSLAEAVQAFKPADYCYRVTLLPAQAHALTLTLAP